MDLGGENDVVAAPGEGFADNLLRLTSRVDVCGVDEVDTGIERAVHDAHAVVVIRIAPFAEHHRPEAVLADGDAGSAQRSRSHPLTLRRDPADRCRAPAPPAAPPHPVSRRSPGV